VDARAIYPPSRQRALVAPARAESYAQLLCIMTVPRARRIYAAHSFRLMLHIYKSTKLMKT
jgi:hypothetical protein